MEAAERSKPSPPLNRAQNDGSKLGTLEGSSGHGCPTLPRESVLHRERRSLDSTHSLAIQARRDTLGDAGDDGGASEGGENAAAVVFLVEHLPRLLLRRALQAASPRRCSHVDAAGERLSRAHRDTQTGAQYYKPRFTDL